MENVKVAQWFRHPAITLLSRFRSIQLGCLKKNKGIWATKSFSTLNSFLLKRKVFEIIGIAKFILVFCSDPSIQSLAGSFPPCACCPLSLESSFQFDL